MLGCRSSGLCREGNKEQVSGAPDSLRSIFFALGANLAIAGTKLFGALFTGSSAMLAEAIHSFADCGNQGLLLLGLHRARRPPSSQHPLGFGKAIYFWSFIVALMLFSMGGLFSIYEGIHRLHAHESLSARWVAIGILTFSMLAEGVSLVGCLREIKKVRGARSLWRWFRESRQSELIVVLGEDVAALFGLTLALGAVLLALTTGNAAFDAAGSIAIGVLLVLVAVAIGVQIHGLLIGESAEPAVQAAIREVLIARSEIDAVLNLITLQLGSDVMVAVKARMAGCETSREMVEGINRCEAALREAVPQVRWVFFEPDLRA